jgi:preprotein translocase subunit SecE
MAAKKRDKSLKSKAVAKQDPEVKSSFQFSRISEFASEVKVEFRKIVWPDKKVTMGSTGVVIVLVCMLSIYLGTVDLFVGKLIGYLFR